MSLGPGSTVGPFKIQSLLGKGGMGEVFAALDTRLDRRVALKVIPGEYSADADRLRRFQLEARTLATLTHPNVALLFGFEEHASRNLLVLELVEGETLADRLRRGPLPVDEALHLARQIASALEAAHEKGIIHRALKPANIKITSDDRAKVLDFGLAKLAAPATSSSATVPADSPTILTGSTLPGVILGTAGYMSPEQAKASPLINAPTSGLSDVSCTSASPAKALSAERPSPNASRPCCTGNWTGPRFRRRHRVQSGCCSVAAWPGTAASGSTTSPMRDWNWNRSSLGPPTTSCLGPPNARVVAELSQFS
jgi:serine/threonine protein kinase